MKRLFGISVVALVGVSTLSFGETQVVTVRRAVLATQYVLANPSVTAEQLVGKTIGGVAVTAAEAPSLLAAASPLVAALRKQGTQVASADLANLADLVDSKFANLQAHAALSAVAQEVAEGRGLANAEAALASAQSDMTNLLPEAVKAMSPADVQAAMLTVQVDGETLSSNSVEEEANQAEIMQAATVAAVENCPVGESQASCSMKAKRFAFSWGSQYAANGSKQFAHEVLQGFKGQEDTAAVPATAYWTGGATAIAEIQATGTQTESLKQIDTCFLTGRPLSSGANN